MAGDAEPKDADRHLMFLWAGCCDSTKMDFLGLSIHLVGVPLLLSAPLPNYGKVSSHIAGGEKGKRAGKDVQSNI